MPIMLNGRKRIAAGIQSVMTHPYYRGKGLMNSLLNKALEYIDTHYEMAFLMTSNPEIYEKYGFRIVRENLYTTKYHHNGSKTKLVHLDMFHPEDLKII